MQFHAYRLRDGRLILDMQSDVIETPTRVVAPLIPERPDLRAISILEPILDIGGERMALHTGEMAAVPAKLVAGPPAADLRDRDYEIRRALDMLFSGF
jgi:toxin CcdB